MPSHLRSRFPERSTTRGTRPRQPLVCCFVCYLCGTLESPLPGSDSPGKIVATSPISTTVDVNCKTTGTGAYEDRGVVAVPLVRISGGGGGGGRGGPKLKTTTRKHCLWKILHRATFLWNFAIWRRFFSFFVHWPKMRSNMAAPLRKDPTSRYLTFSCALIGRAS